MEVEIQYPVGSEVQGGYCKIVVLSYSCTAMLALVNAQRNIYNTTIIQNIIIVLLSLYSIIIIIILTDSRDLLCKRPDGEVQNHRYT